VIPILNIASGKKNTIKPILDSIIIGNFMTYNIINNNAIAMLVTKVEIRPI
jgi:hypothetical protein